MPQTPRKTPCATCPYRRSVPSGIWHPDEYAKLPRYDRETFEQPISAFGCHHADGQICAGWLGHGDPDRLLAVRIGIVDGRLDPTCANYVTDVPLFASGAQAAEHGLRDIHHPTPEALAAMRKVTGNHITTDEGAA